jgi:hypothetical protein
VGEWWRDRNAAPEAPGVETFTILTTEPNELCALIHNRMSVILAPEDRAVEEFRFPFDPDRFGGLCVVSACSLEYSLASDGAAEVPVGGCLPLDKLEEHCFIAS